MKPFDGQVAVVTSGADGIGRATVELLLGRGAATVVIADQDQVRGEQLANDLGPAAQFRAVDVSKPDQLTVLFDAVRTDHERLDVLVCSAGIGTGLVVTPGHPHGEIPSAKTSLLRDAQQRCLPQTTRVVEGQQRPARPAEHAPCAPVAD